MAYNTYNLSVLDLTRQKAGAAMATGGKVLVVAAGTAQKRTLYNPDSDFASLSNPVSFSRGRLRFATLSTVESVDIYGFAPTGHFIAYRGVKPGEAEFVIDTTQLTQVAHVPWYAADYTAASENDTGLDLPAGAALMPGAHLRVTAIDATETLDVGLLSSESGGDADGIFAGISVATSGTIAPAVSSPTLGALLRTLAGTTPDVAVPRVYGVSTAVSISLTPSTGSDTGEGFIVLPYILPPL